MKTHVNPSPAPIFVSTALHNILHPGTVPPHLRGIIHSTPEADKLISIRAKQGPARNGRKKYKGPIRYSTDNHPLFSII